MALKTTITTTEKLGSVLVTQSALASDIADDDVTTVATSLANKVLSFEVVNGSNSAIYFKMYNSLSPTLSSDIPAFKVLISASTTAFFGVSVGITFATAISVAASTSSGAENSPVAYTGTVSYTLIAGV